MTSVVNNGRRVAVEHPTFNGEAGLVESRGVTMLAFIPTNPHERPEEGTAILVGGEARKIASVRRSSTVKNMVVLTLEREG